MIQRQTREADERSDLARIYICVCMSLYARKVGEGNDRALSPTSLEGDRRSVTFDELSTVEGTKARLGDDLNAIRNFS